MELLWCCSGAPSEVAMDRYLEQYLELYLESVAEDPKSRNSTNGHISKSSRLSDLRPAEKVESTICCSDIVSLV